jgi:PGF-CTERM protein
MAVVVGESGGQSTPTVTATPGGTATTPTAGGTATGGTATGTATTGTSGPNGTTTSGTATVPTTPGGTATDIQVPGFGPVTALAALAAVALLGRRRD